MSNQLFCSSFFSRALKRNTTAISPSLSQHSQRSQRSQHSPLRFEEGEEGEGYRDEGEEEEGGEPATLKEAMAKIRRLEVMNASLTKQVHTSDATVEHMAATLSKIGTRIVAACDKVNDVLREREEKMMSDQLTSMETLMNLTDND